MLKYVVGIIVFAVVATGAYYLWDFIGKFSTEGMPAQETPGEVVIATTTYAAPNFSLVHPVNFVVDENYQYEGVPNKPIIGVKFSIPGTMATGTNLSALDTGVSVEWLPRAQNCTGDIYVLDNVSAREMTERGVVYSVATTSDAGVGNLYEEQVYALVESSPCTAVRYFIHSANIGNYEPGAINEFDRSKLLRTFDDIRRSLVLFPPQI